MPYPHRPPRAWGLGLLFWLAEVQLVAVVTEPLPRSSAGLLHRPSLSLGKGTLLGGSCLSTLLGSSPALLCLFTGLGGPTLDQCHTLPHNTYCGFVGLH